MGQTSSATYNSLGQLLTKTNSLGQTVSYSFDNEGNLATVSDADGNTTSYVRDIAGNILMVTNAEGQMVRYEMDAMNRLLAVTDAKGERTAYQYLASGELEKITDPLGNVALLEYNNMGRLIKKTDPLGMVNEFFYDPNGNLIGEKDPNGNVKTYEYDDLGQLVKKILPDNVYEYSFDVRGNLTQAKNNASIIDIDYTRTETGDQASAVSLAGMGDISDYPEIIINHSYDSSGNRIGTESNFGSLSYSFDTGNRLVGLTNHKGQDFVYSFDHGNRLVLVRTPATEMQISFDNTNFMTSITHRKRSPASIIQSFEYERDNIGNRTLKRTPAGEQILGYDANNQLISATNPEAIDEIFTYDQIGNRTQDQSQNYFFDPRKQKIQEDASYLYVFDNNGNLISKQKKGMTGEVTNFIYSSENQLVQIDFFVNSQLVKEAHYVFDAIGRRVQKKVIDHQDQNKSLTRRYAYNGGEILAELDEENDILAIYTHSGLRTDDMLAVEITPEGQTKGLALGSGDYYFIKDGLGSVTDIASSSGEVIQKHVYSAFGKILRIRDSAGNDISGIPALSPYFTYTGREFDIESGLLYYRARMYDAALGRFIQKDRHPGVVYNPLTVVNSYIYSLNDSHNRIDPSGNFSLKGLGEVALGAIAGYVFGAVGSAIGALVALSTSYEFSDGQKTAVYIAAIVVASAFTGGAAGAQMGIAAGGGLAGLVSGGVAGAVTGGVTGAFVGGGIAVLTGNSLQEGMAMGLRLGAISGGIAGAIAGYNTSATLESETAFNDPAGPVGDNGTSAGCTSAMRAAAVMTSVKYGHMAFGLAINLAAGIVPPLSLATFAFSNAAIGIGSGAADQKVAVSCQ